MHTTNLRRVGGSVMMVVPPALLDLLEISAGAQVGLTVENGRLVVQPRPRPSYTLNELLAQCDASASITAEDQEWLGSSPVGAELL